MEAEELKVALPCMQFAKKSIELIKDFGFITYPRFFDNYAFAYETVDWEEHLELFRENKEEIEFAVLPDEKYNLMFQLKGGFPEIKWIFPLHKKEEVAKANRFGDWIGFPHRAEWRDYSLNWFLNKFEESKKWYLGFWRENEPEVLFRFDGFDSTLPETYAGRFGKIWKNWGEHYKPKEEKHWRELLKINLKNFKEAINKLDNQKTLVEVKENG